MMMKGKEMTNRHADAIDFILDSADNDQLSSLVEAIKHRRETLARRNRFSFKTGMQVKFTHRNVEYTGTLLSVKVKKAAVACTLPKSVTYNVPLNMLQAA